MPFGPVLRIKPPLLCVCCGVGSHLLELQRSEFETRFDCENGSVNILGVPTVCPAPGVVLEVQKESEPLP